MQAKLIGKNAIDSMINLIEDFAFGNDDVPEKLVDEASNISNALKMITLCDAEDENKNEVVFMLNDQDLITLGKIYNISNDEDEDDND